ncbi:hypothetical protein J6590_103798 [Homalodisca vitripennis]|nr:hypothetical protein J6590_103798 [Homalodisca vitripennis]
MVVRPSGRLGTYQTCSIARPLHVHTGRAELNQSLFGRQAVNSYRGTTFWAREISRAKKRVDPQVTGWFLYA